MRSCFMAAMAVACCLVGLVGCGGGSSSDDDGGSSGSPTPRDLAIEQRDFVDVTISWQGVDEAQSYHLYYASDPEFEPENYATYTHGDWIQDVSSPVNLTLPEPGPNYYFVITAVDEAGEESPPSRPLVQQTHFSIHDDSGETIDRYGYTWKRCAEGQTWIASSASCEGSPMVFSAEQLEEHYPAFGDSEWRLPFSFEARFSCPPYLNGEDDGSSHCFDKVFPDSVSPGDTEERYTFINEANNDHCGRWLHEDARYWVPCEMPGLVLLMKSDGET